MKETKLLPRNHNALFVNYKCNRDLKLKTITGEHWREVGALPSRIYGLRGASLDNIFHAIICAHHQNFQTVLLFLTRLKILEAKSFFFLAWL